ncbi:MAG: gliding motility protein GldM, partial [Bacteroidota bacterium]
MMYLVLLALLAMNVSAEILDAFEQIKEKLNQSATTAQLNNNDFVSNMNDKIKEELSEGKED